VKVRKVDVQFLFSVMLFVFLSDLRNVSSGDLFVDGKVIRRPQYDFSDRQPSRSRPRPRHDRRRDRVQTVGRGPMQPPTQSWSQVQMQTMQAPTSVHDQGGTEAQGGNPSLNR